MFAIFLILIFLRPFISSLAFGYLNLIYSSILLGFLIIFLIDKGIQIKQIQSLKLPLLLFILALTISISFSTDKMNSLKELYKYISGILIFLAAISFNYKEKIRVTKVIVLAAFLISLLAIYQYFFGFRHILDYLARHEISFSSFTLEYIQRKRVFFPFVTPNTLAGYLAMTIPLILASWNAQKKIFLNPACFMLISLSLVLLLAKSMGALLSIFLGLIIYFYLLGALDKKRLVILVGFLATIGVIFVLRQTSARLQALPTYSWIMRLKYWIETLRIIKTVPWQGVGLGNFNLASVRYAHNSYLQLWAEMGILGIASFLWLIIAVFKSAFKNIKNSQNNKLIVGLITANAVFLIHNLFDFSFFLPEIAIIWWLTLGLLKGFYSSSTII